MAILGYLAIFRLDRQPYRAFNRRRSRVSHDNHRRHLEHHGRPTAIRYPPDPVWIPADSSWVILIGEAG